MKKFLVSILCLSVSFGSLGQATAFIFPDADNTILSNTVGNSNALGKLYVGNNCSFFNRRALLHFDIAAAIPAGATITSATLTLDNDSMGISPMTLNFSLYPVTQAWGEGTSSGAEAGAAATAGDATWSSAMFGSTLWGTPGGDYGAPSATTPLPPSIGTYDWFSPDMAAEIQGWLDAPATNFGWILIGAEGTNCATRRFGSKDSGTQPVLTVEYTCTAPTAICQDISLYLDDIGSAIILDDALDGGSTAMCGITGYFASQTSFDCDDINYTPEIYITAIYDGPLTGGTPKGVEVYVASDIADMSQFAIGWPTNGGGSDGIEFTFPAVSVSAGTFLYVASESPQFTAWFGFAPDYVDGDANVNGNDACELFKDGVVIDRFGDPDVDGTGEGWEYTDGWAYRDDMTGPDVIFVESNWTYSGTDALDGETDNASAFDPVPVGTFVPPSSTGSVPVTLTVMEMSGLTDECIANVTVLDTISPDMLCSAFTTIMLDATGTAVVTAGDVDAGSVDNCQMDSIWTDITSVSCAEIGSLDVVLFGVDIYGNTSACISTITVDGSAVVSVSDVVTDVSCPGDSDGAVNITPSGGSGTYTYDWDNDGTGDFDDTQDLSGLGAGDYTVNVVDDNGCSGTVLVTVNEPAPIDNGISQAGATLTADATGVTYQWIDCGTMTNIAGETTQNFTATVDGSYACVVTDAPCSDTTACIDIAGIGFSENAGKNFMMFPNPASDIVNFISATTIETISIVDMQGRVILCVYPSSKTTSIFIGQVETGSYTAILHFEDQSTQMLKLILD